MRQFFAPADAPLWLRLVLGSIRDALSDVWTTALRLKDYTTANLPPAADWKQGLAYDSTAVAIKFSNGTSWTALSASGHTHTENEILLGATDRLVGRDTAGAGAAEELTVGGGIEFTGAGGIQTSAFTGDVTKAAGGTAQTIPNDTVTYAKLQNVSVTARLLGRATAGAGDVEEISLGTNLSFTGTTLNAASSGVSDGDKGDISVTVSGTVWTIDPGVVTLAKMADMATASLFYRKTAGAGAPEVNTLATLKTDLLLAGTNSGDQTSIVGITGTLAQFNTAVTDADLVPAARSISTTAPLTGGGDLSANRTFAIDAATTIAAGSMSAADKAKLDGFLTPVHMSADAAARGPAIADYFATTLSLEAASTYDIECHAHFTKTTAGTVTFTWLFSNAPTICTSRYESTPATGYTTALVTGAPVQAQVTARAVAAMAHAASGSLTTAVDHSFVFWVRVRTNLAATLQLRSTEGAGTITPRAGSYMKAVKVV